jgi:hypothetical protein
MADTSPPVVSSIVYGPNDGALAIRESVNLTVTFNEAVKYVSAPKLNLAQGWSNNNTFHRQVGDINGDGYPDILAFGNSATFTAINHGEYVM